MPSRLQRIKRELRVAAATDIQEVVRGYLQRRKHRAAVHIQKHVWRYLYQRLFRSQQQMAQRIQQAFRATNRTVFALQKQLRKALRAQQHMLKYVPKGDIVCPITHCVIQEPVMNLLDNRLYERKALQQWLKTHNTCPTTRQDNVEWVQLDRISATMQTLSHQITHERKECAKHKALSLYWEKRYQHKLEKGGHYIYSPFFTLIKQFLRFNKYNERIHHKRYQHPSFTTLRQAYAFVLEKDGIDLQHVLDTFNMIVDINDLR